MNVTIIKRRCQLESGRVSWKGLEGEREEKNDVILLQLKIYIYFLFFLRSNHEREGEVGKANHRVSLLPREAGSAPCPAPRGRTFGHFCDCGVLRCAAIAGGFGSRLATVLQRARLLVGGEGGTEHLPPRPSGAGKTNSVASWADRPTGPRAPRLGPVPGVWSVSGRLEMGFLGHVLKL